MTFAHQLMLCHPNESEDHSCYSAIRADAYQLLMWTEWQQTQLAVHFQPDGQQMRMFCLQVKKAKMLNQFICKKTTDLNVNE